MESMREAWTDDRLDHLNHRVDEGFTQVDRRFKEVDRRFEQVDHRFEQVDKRFDKVDFELQRVNDRIDGLQRTMVHAIVAMTTAMLAGFGGIAGLIATQI
jgi:uncharacterized protein YPO0396